MQRKTFAIDFDGVIHDYKHPVEGKRMGPPIAGAKAALTKLAEDGHEIIIHSCKSEKAVVQWMDYFDIPFTSIWNDKGKPIADYYIDDKALRFYDWESTLTSLEIDNGTQS